MATVITSSIRVKPLKGETLPAHILLQNLPLNSPP
jgi:hypothetical protein